MQNISSELFFYLYKLLPSTPNPCFIAFIIVRTQDGSLIITNIVSSPATVPIIALNDKSAFPVSISQSHYPNGMQKNERTQANPYY